MAKMASEEELAEMEKLSAGYVPDQKVGTTFEGANTSNNLREILSVFASQADD